MMLRDPSRLSLFPHLSWIVFHAQCPPRTRLSSFRWDGCVHAISLTSRGEQTVCWETDGTETRWTDQAGTVRFVPADGRRHVRATTMSPDVEASLLLIPPRHLSGCLPRCLGADAAVGGPRGPVTLDDPQLCSCLARLSTRLADVADAHTTPEGTAPPGTAKPRTARAGTGHASTAANGRFAAAVMPSAARVPPTVMTEGEAARSLVSRLSTLVAGRPPDWNADEGMFDTQTLDHVVGHIDSRLRYSPSLNDLAIMTGLSQSHFARKFARTTGESVFRFIGRRRIRAATTALAHDDVPLARLARGLGFCSQSHFTRVFHALTGMTPAVFRAHFGRGAA